VTLGDRRAAGRGPVRCGAHLVANGPPFADAWHRWRWVGGSGQGSKMSGPRWRWPLIVRAVLVIAVAVGLSGSPANAPPAAAATPCRAGYVALTFDDGPDAATTGAILDVLERRQVRATFFVVGQRVDAQPRLVARAAREGHTVANHTYGHERLTALGDAAIVRTVDRTDGAIRRAGATPLRLVRPPYGAWDTRVRRVLSDAGYTPILWTLDSDDWRASASRIRSNVRAGLRDGAVILLHDGVRNSTETLSALPGIIDDATSRGLCFATLDAAGRLVRTPFDWRAAGWPYRDVPVNSTHAASITRLRDAGVTVGCEEDRYCPDAPVTRAQMASFLQRALGLPAGPTDGYRDVGTGSPHAAAIGALAAAGITLGCSLDGRSYCPNESVRRDQMASFLQRALALPPGRTDRFRDVDPRSTHAAAIGAVDAAGITRGCDASGLRYCPTARVSRAQMASFVARTMDARAR
jgi:peptidoglycan/xylan/chitin deacetylase (PgdA/CDA1 family)